MAIESCCSLSCASRLELDPRFWFTEETRAGGGIEVLDAAAIEVLGLNDVFALNVSCKERKESVDAVDMVRLVWVF